MLCSAVLECCVCIFCLYALFCCPTDSVQYCVSFGSMLAAFLECMHRHVFSRDSVHVLRIQMEQDVLFFIFSSIYWFHFLYAWIPDYYEAERADHFFFLCYVHEYLNCGLNCHSFLYNIEPQTRISTLLYLIVPKYFSTWLTFLDSFHST
jgi:hypothetical protein